MAGMARSGRVSGNVIWLDSGRDHSMDALSFSFNLIAFAAILCVGCLAADILSEAIVAWLGRDLGWAPGYVSATALL
jgi:hypothetical protein